MTTGKRCGPANPSIVNKVSGHAVEQVRRQIAGTVLLAILLMGLPTLVSNIVNDFKLSAPDSPGASLALIFKPGTIAYLVGICLLIFRKKLPLGLISATCVTLLVIVGIQSLFDLGFIGSGMLFFMIACALGAMFFDGWRALVPAIVSIAAIAMGGWLWVNGVRTFYFDPAEYATSWNTYVVRMITIVFFLAIIVGSIRKMNGFLAGSLRAQTLMNEDLRESEEKYRALVEAALESIFIAQDGMIRFCNKSFSDFSGYTLEGLTDRPFTELIHPDDRQTVVDRYVQRLEGKEVPSRYTFRFVDASGNTRWADMAVSLISWEGKPASLCVAADITERRLAESARKEAFEKLRVREEQYEFITANVMDLIAYAGSDGRYRYVSPSCRAILGYDPADPESVAGFRTLHPDDRDRITGLYSDAISRKESSLRYEARLRHKDGRHVPFEVSVKILYDERGAYSGFLLTGRDITDRKRAEEALRESRDHFQSLVDNIPGITYRCRLDRDWTMHYMSDSVEPLTGYHAVEFIQNAVRTFESVIHPEDTAFVRQSVNTAAAEGLQWDIEYRVRHKDGVIRWVHEKGRGVHGEDGKVAFLDGFILDITERKQAVEALQASEKRAALQRTAIAELVLDQVFTEDNITIALQRICEFITATLGIARASVWTLTEDGSELRCVSLYEADSKKHSGGAILKAADLPNYFAAIKSENRIYAEDAQKDPRTSELTESYLKVLGITSMLDAGIVIEGRLDGVICSENIGPMRKWYPDEESFISTAAAIVAQLFLNIERKRAEEALRENEQRYQTIFNTSPVMFWLKDTANNIIQINKAAADFEGVGPFEINGRSCYDLYPREQAEGYYQDDLQVIHSGKPKFGIIEKHTPPGTDRAIILETGKVPILDQNGKVTGVLAFAVNISERHEMEVAVKTSEAKFRSIVESSPVGYHIYNLEEDGRLVFSMFNQAADIILRTSHGPFIGREILEAFPGLAGTDIPEIYMAVARGELGTQNFEAPYDHGSIHGVYEVRVFRSAPGQAVVNFIDITARKRAEEEWEKLHAQLAQAQKMESVGRLAGGVAHDFNNMLGVILGHTELALGRVGPDEPLRSDLEEIGRSARRSADLTRQLLAFARRQTIAPKVLDLNETVEGMLTMLRRLIGEDIDVAWKPGDELWPVMMDPSQIDQVLVNLCVNARDAIAGVGKVTIETDNAVLEEEYCAGHEGFVPGDYVLLAVSDDGRGMDAETLSHIFEPFFTTREAGRGTGLGLSTVFGAVKQNNGFINVYSEPGRGTVFKVFLPRHAAGSARRKEERGLREATRGSETILLVEDEPMILKVATTMLETLGYTVLAASTPGEAIRLARDHPGRIDLLMTDVVMPEMNGRDLARNLLSIHPDIRRLFMSGYTANVIAHRGVLDEGVHFLQKPFSMKDLGEKIREALE